MNATFKAAVVHGEVGKKEPARGREGFKLTIRQDRGPCLMVRTDFSASSRWEVEVVWREALGWVVTRN